MEIRAAARVSTEQIHSSFCSKQHKFSQLDERSYGGAEPGRRALVRHSEGKQIRARTFGKDRARRAAAFLCPLRLFAGTPA
jgi:hypothetical protein